MKKILLLLLPIMTLAACDNNKIIGKCLPNERTTTITEQNGKKIETSITELFLCGCFQNQDTALPDFIISKDEFSFETTNTESTNDIEDSIEYTKRITTESIPNTTTQETNKNCDKKCTKLCNKK
jgi:hypothetical protein